MNEPVERLRWSVPASETPLPKLRWLVKDEAHEGGHDVRYVLEHAATVFAGPLNRIQL